MYNYQQHLHFIGIGGVGMAGIAEVLLNLGYSISGSDLKTSPLTEHLQSLGAEIAFGHKTENVPERTSVVVISSAVPETNPELVTARLRGLPVIPRAEMLAELMRMKYGIAVAGSHGKTTTTSMTAKLLRDIGLDPTVIVGGRVLSQNSGARVGQGDYLVAEADESDGSFCLLRPAIAIVTNIDLEHLSHYQTFGALEEAFYVFLKSIPFYGLIVACGDDPVVKRLAKRVSRRIRFYGLSPENEINAQNIVIEDLVTVFDLYIDGSFATKVRLPVAGRHMVSNALASIAVGLELGGFPEELAESLSSFSGVSRRTEKVGEAQGVLVLDDYAHHPTEIRATLKAVKESWVPFQAKQSKRETPGKLIALFEPHRYSRTRELFGDFLRCFDDADEVIVGDIYAAGEAEIVGLSSADLVASMQHPAATYSPKLDEALTEIIPRLQPGDVVLTLGAGPITKIAHKLASLIEVR